MKNLWWTLAVLLTVAGCNGSNSGKNKESEEAEYKVYSAYQDRDYNRILTLADSFKTNGLFSEGKACYWLGYANDRLMQKRMAEFYWNMGMAATENATDDESVRVYAGIANRLTGLKCSWGEYEAALRVAVPAVERLSNLGCDTTSEYTNLLIYKGCCQSRFGINESMVDQTLDRAYMAHLENVRRQANAIACRDAIVGIVNIIFNYVELRDYKKALQWIDRYGDMLNKYEKMPDARLDYVDRQRARYELFRATALEGVGRKNEAVKAYEMFQRQKLSQTAEGKILGCDYLRVAEKWQEAADNYSYLDEMMLQFKSTYSLENIQKALLKKFEINMMAGRIDTAQAVSMAIVQHLDSAITETQIADAREHEAVHQKEMEMAAEREHAQQQRQMGRLAMMTILVVALLIYIIVRHRVQVRLKKAHNQLQQAYDQLEETTTVKERMESELRIARDIQMSMVPRVFPEREGLDMYASMTPAKEVGGDLYGYLLLDNNLYFVVGDVSGKGVPASLFMAQATRLFLTLAKQGMMPAEICTRINDALSGQDNESGMFVTLWLGLVDLTSGHLDFCNAGHNPPVIGGGDSKGEFLDMKANAPIGLWPGLDYEGEQVESIKDRPLFIYTDGLNEAENPQQEQFGDERLLDILRKTNFSSAQQVVDTLRQEVEAHRNGAEPNDDLTMMCLKVTSV